MGDLQGKLGAVNRSPLVEAHFHEIVYCFSADLTLYKTILIVNKKCSGIVFYTFQYILCSTVFMLNQIISYVKKVEVVMCLSHK